MAKRCLRGANGEEQLFKPLWTGHKWCEPFGFSDKLDTHSQWSAGSLALCLPSVALHLETGDPLLDQRSPAVIEVGSLGLMIVILSLDKLLLYCCFTSSLQQQKKKGGTCHFPAGANSLSSMTWCGYLLAQGREGLKNVFLGNAVKRAAPDHKTSRAHYPCTLSRKSSRRSRFSS